MTKKGKGKSKAMSQPGLPASPKGRKPAALAVEYNGETSPKTKIPQTLRNELEVGIGLPKTGDLTVPRSAGAGRKPSVSIEPPPPLLTSASEALESNVKGGAGPARMPPPGNREYSTIPVRPKVLRRFYEPVLLLHLLGRIRGARTKRPDSPDLKHSKQGRRRDFTDAIAYICASNTGGEHVMAAALENTPQGITVWLAANSSKAGENVLAFLHDILTELKGVDARDKAAQDKTESRIFSKIIRFNQRRVNDYWDKTKDCIAQCLEVIRGSEEFEGRDELIQWLEAKLADCSEATESLVRECYDAARKGAHWKQFDDIERFIGDGKTKSEKFEMLRYHICKLGKHLAITKRMITISTMDCTLFSEFEIKLLDSPGPETCNLVPRNTTIEGIFNRMFTDTKEKEAILEPLKPISDALGLPQLLKEKGSFKTRVHAELLLVDHFYTQKLGFVDNDKYVGCSKPACFLCYQYISAHPGNFALPATHQKLYHSWRHPDIIANRSGADDSETLKRLQKCREDIINEMTKKIRLHLIEQIRGGNGQRRPHPDSSTGVSTSLVAQYL